MEIWKDIIGYEGYYQVSNTGVVRSLDRYIIRSDDVIQFRRGQNIVPIESTDGYYQIKLCKNGRSKTFGIHQLVGLHFLKKPDDFDKYDYEINHIDCNRKNNHIDNLEWLTHKDNIHYSIKKKHHVCTRNLFGENNPNYGNHILSDRYRENPDLAKEKLSRPGSQNGHAQKILLYDNNKNLVKQFAWIGECIEFLKSNNYTKLSESTLRNKICKAAKTQKLFSGHYFKYI